MTNLLGASCAVPFLRGVCGSVDYAKLKPALLSSKETLKFSAQWPPAKVFSLNSCARGQTTQHGVAMGQWLFSWVHLVVHTA